METTNPKIDPAINAILIAEGVQPASFQETVEAWAHLIGSGLVWNLQGWFGRTAARLIESGLIDRNGNIDWDIAEEVAFA